MSMPIKPKPRILRFREVKEKSMLAIEAVTPTRSIADSAPKKLRIASALKQPMLAPAKSAKYILFVMEAKPSKINAAHMPAKKKGITEAKKYNGNKESEKGNCETAQRYIIK
ncbi:MAG: hypothetical protein ACUVQX_01480 [Candidatus Bathycorpusculaceae bacterium]